MKLAVDIDVTMQDIKNFTLEENDSIAVEKLGKMLRDVIMYHQVSVKTKEGTLSAFVCPLASSAGVTYQHDKDSEVIDVVGVRDNNGDIDAFTYENPYSENYTNIFVLKKDDIEKALDIREE